MLNNISLLGAVTAIQVPVLEKNVIAPFLSPQTRETMQGYFLAAYSCFIRGISYNW